LGGEERAMFFAIAALCGLQPESDSAGKRERPLG
jgi:hypothetical protein